MPFLQCSAILYPAAEHRDAGFSRSLPVPFICWFGDGCHPNERMVLICISLMICKVGHLFRSFLASDVLLAKKKKKKVMPCSF